jgi:hypothetical protein
MHNSQRNNYVYIPKNAVAKCVYLKKLNFQAFTPFNIQHVHLIDWKISAAHSS